MRGNSIKYVPVPKIGHVKSGLGRHSFKFNFRKAGVQRWEELRGNWKVFLDPNNSDGKKMNRPQVTVPGVS